MSGTRRSLENYDPAEQETLMYVKMHLRVTHSHVRSHHVDADAVSYTHLTLPTIYSV